MSNEPEDRWRELCDRWGAQGYASLSHSEKTWLNIRSMIDSIENGGLISYFYNSGADTLSDCLEDLGALKATEVLRQVQRVCDLFDQGVPADLEARNDIIDSWHDEDGTINELLEEVDDTLMPLMEDLERRLVGHLKRSGLAP